MIQKEYGKVLTSISFLFVLGQICFYAYLIISNLMNVKKKILIEAIICSLLVIVIYIVIIRLMTYIIENEHRQEKEELKLLEQKYEYQYSLLIQEQKREIHKNQNDILEQLLEMQKIFHDHSENKKKQAKEIFEKLENQIEDIGKIQYCADPVFNTVLILKQEEAQKHGISMDIRIHSMMELNVDDIDKCCILTNLLDNAIESAKKVLGHPNILVRIGKRAGYLVVKIENPTVNDLKKNANGKYMTSKRHVSSKKHGRGLSIVQSIVEKNNGYFKIEKVDDTVSVVVFLPVKSE
ncbi:MAG: ATP-binding protein [Lachnospiraceae bacterium]|nr:ATP-binding protein [Lachnospiraceae bacterium]